uniref:Uncharacterized protein n=1 Tax=Rhizophora mucronata TaxID=61149 RepID=A0A2P2Q9C1_RHIMU
MSRKRETKFSVIPDFNGTAKLVNNFYFSTLDILDSTTKI